MLHKNYFKKITAIFFIIGMVLISASNIFAQDNKQNISESNIANLNIAIKSSNDGLRKSAIHLVGKYLIKESAETLIDQLKLEKDASIRILITKVLYMIGNEDYMNDISKLASKDQDLNVREYASSVYSMMKLEKSINIADINN